MRCEVQRFVGVVLLGLGVLGLAGAAGGQVPASSFEELRLITRVGKSVTVVGPDGQAVTGNLLDVSPEHLTVLVKRQPIEFERWQVRLVQERYDDPVGDGALKGAVWAAAPALILTANWCPFCLRVAVGYGVFGALFGTLVDAGVQSTRPIYLPPVERPRAGLALAPLVAPGRTGVMLSFGF